MSLFSWLRGLFGERSKKAALVPSAPRTWTFVDIDAGVSPTEIARIAPGLQAQLREDFAPAWGSCGQDTVLPMLMTSAAAFAAGYCQIQLHLEAPADEQGALAIHGNDAAGRPIAHAYVALLARCGTSLSSAASHELLEASADADCTRTVKLPDGRVAAVEICDQVEALSYLKGDVEVSDFNLPSNFGIGSTKAPYDFLGKQPSAFQVLAGGYAQVLDPSTGWTQLSAPDGMRAYRAELARLGLGRGARRQGR